MPANEIVRKLRHAGHKVTPQRITIIQQFLQSSELLTPAALYARVHELDPRIGEVTVYRTLNILAEMGLICMIHTGGNSHSYISRPPENHGHLICSDCNRVIDFTDCDVFELRKKLSDETGFKIEDCRLDFYGRCRECALNTVE